MTDSSAPPGPTLRSAAYQDLCGFFAKYADAQAWEPRLGDWVVVPPGIEPRLVLSYDKDGDALRLLGDGESAVQAGRESCVWLPTLDQLAALIREHFGTTGLFTSAFNGSTYWYTGQMLGMTVTNMQPLAEGSSPEEAAVKALLMRHQW